MQFLLPDMFIRIFLLAIFSCSTLFAQVIYPSKTYSSPKLLKEFSGIARVSASVFAGINDSGNQPELITFDSTGKMKTVVALNNCKNYDWEELVSDKEMLYVCDFGDNMCSRKFSTIYKINKSDFSLSAKYDFTLNEKGVSTNSSSCLYDAEAAFVVNDTMHLFTKSHADPYRGISYHYQFPLNQNQQEISAKDSFNFGDGGFLNNSITGAAISPDKSRIAFISCKQLYVFLTKNYLNPFNGYFIQFDFDGLTQKEAVTFLDNERLMVADERLGIIGGKMYTYSIEKYLNGRIRYTIPSVSCSFGYDPVHEIITMNIKSKTVFSDLRVLFFDEKGKLMNETVLAKNVRQHQQSVQRNFLRPYHHFWIVDGKRIVYTKEIKI